MIMYKFWELFCPGNRVTVDESIMLCKGQLHWKQFISTKQACLTCENVAHTELRLSISIEMHFTVPLLHEDINVYLYNWYNSPTQLYNKQYNRSINAYRMVWQKYTGLPKKTDTRALKRGETEVWQLPPKTYIIRNDKCDIPLHLITMPGWIWLAKGNGIQRQSSIFSNWTLFMNIISIWQVLIWLTR